MKFCKDCAHYKIEIKSERYPALKAVIETEYQNCTKIERVDLVSGKKKPNLSCSYCRQDKDLCGEEAIHWVQRTTD